MQDYNFYLMKKTLERIHYCVALWREVTEKAENGEECSYEIPEEVGDDMLAVIEDQLKKAGFHE
jgi:hypothetical protein